MAVASTTMRGTRDDDTPVVVPGVVLLTEIPAPFRIPLFNALADSGAVGLDVLFLSDRDPKRPYRVYADEFRFRWRILPRRELVRGGRWIVFSGGVLRALRRLRPAVVVVGGWNQPAFWLAALYSGLARVPLVAWVESTSRDERVGRAWTEVPKRLIVGRCAAFLVPGRASRDYLLGLGVTEDRITVAPNAVDTSLFGTAVDVARRDRDGLRQTLGLTRCTFLCVGRLDREKGIDLLLDAMRDVEADLVVAGRGPEQERLRALAPSNVRFAGWLERDELVQWYAAADAFVLPSRSEQWGMVLNEAATAGLPLIATEAVGAAHDLIEDGVNGFRVPTREVAPLTRALARVAADAGLRLTAGRRSRELARQHTPTAWAEAVAATVRRLAD
jgi:glycosyltransferase involved in cell wall biosynthesis